MVLETIKRALHAYFREERSIELEPDEIYSLLGDSQRRAVIQFVAEELTVGETAPLADVAAYVAAIETDAHPSEVTDSRRQDVETALRHRHLAQLTSAGVVTCTRAMEIGRGQDVDALAQLVGEVERSAAASSAARYLPDLSPKAPSQKESSVSEINAV